MTFFIVSVVVALVVSFVCSLMEAALLSLTPSQLADLSARHPRVGSLWRGFKTDIERPIAAILILNTTAHTIGASVAGSRFDELFGDEWIWVFGLAFTFVMLQYTEILPKTLGVRLNRRVAGVVGTPLLLAVKALTPVIQLIHWLNRPFEGRSHSDRSPSTVDEIAALAAMARLSKQIGDHQERIIIGASRIARISVRQIMIPIDQVSFLSTSQSLGEAVTAAQVDSHTRFPVCRGPDRDDVVGYVNCKEMASYRNTHPDETSMTKIIRPLRSVAATCSGADLLKSLVDNHEHIAIVRDERGKPIGIVTLEDVVEELVGEVEDEFDRLPRHVHHLSGPTWLVGGGVSMRELSSALDGRLPLVEESVAAWAERELARAAAPGDVVRCGALRIQIRRVRRRRVFEVAITESP